MVSCTGFTMDAVGYIMHLIHKITKKHHYIYNVESNAEDYQLFKDGFVRCRTNLQLEKQLNGKVKGDPMGRTSHWITEPLTDFEVVE